MATVYPNKKDGKIVSFKFKAFVGRDDFGKQIFKCKTWKPNKPMAESKMLIQAEKEATIWERQLLEQMQNQPVFVAPKIKFKEFVESIWFPEQMSDKDHRLSTISFHRSLLKIIYQFLGHRFIDQIVAKDIENYLTYLKTNFKTAKNASPSPKTIRHHYCTLNLIFNYACKTKYITNNPVAKVSSPKLTKHKVDALSKNEVTAFLQEVDKLPLMQKTMYHLLLTTGLRRGECFGLQWNDIDFANGILHVRRNVTYTSLSGICVGLPKTNAGIRDIPLTDNMMLLLKAYHAKDCNDYSLSASSFVFHSSTDSYHPHEPTYLTKHLKKFMKRVGLPDMSPHDLRHTCASILLQSGADIKSVQDILGHTDASTTLNFYARSNIDCMRNATQKAFNF